MICQTCGRPFQAWGPGQPVCVCGLMSFKKAFFEVVARGELQPTGVAHLRAVAAYYRLDWTYALGFIKGDAVGFVDHVAGLIVADGIVTAAEELYFHNVARELGLADSDVYRARLRLDYCKAIGKVRAGDLPSVAPSGRVELDTDEVCHFEAMATLLRRSSKGAMTRQQGRLLATSKKLYWHTGAEWNAVPWASILSIEIDANGLHVGTTRKNVAGVYQVADALWAEAVVGTALRVSKRQVVKEGPAPRSIPQDVRAAVWQRDGGRCRECGATEYLEYDHVIPHSKGGASSVDNVQLLCRKHNMKKRDRI